MPIRVSPTDRLPVGRRRKPASKPHPQNFGTGFNHSDHYIPETKTKSQLTKTKTKPKSQPVKSKPKTKAAPRPKTNTTPVYSNPTYTPRQTTTLKSKTKPKSKPQKTGATATGADTLVEYKDKPKTKKSVSKKSTSSKTSTKSSNRNSTKINIGNRRPASSKTVQETKTVTKNAPIKTKEKNVSKSTIDKDFINNMRDLVAQGTQAGTYLSGESITNPAYTQQQLEQMQQNTLNRVISGVNQGLDLQRGTGLINTNFGIENRRDVINNLLDNSTNAAFNQQRSEATQNLNRADNQYALNRLQTIADMRKNLQTSGMNAQNSGTIGANVLSSYLQGQQQDAQQTTQNLNALQNIAGQRRAELQKNAVEALTQANTASNQIATQQIAEKAARMGAIGQGLYGMGNLAGEAAKATTQTAREYGNTFRAEPQVTAPYTQTKTAKQSKTKQTTTVTSQKKTVNKTKSKAKTSGKKKK